MGILFTGAYGKSRCAALEISNLQGVVSPIDS